MSHRARLFALPLLLVFLAACGVKGGGGPIVPQPPPPPTTVASDAFVVTVEDHGIEGARVICAALPWDLTNADGYTANPAVPVGSTICDITAEGFNAQSIPHDFQPDTVGPRVQLERVVPPPPPVQPLGHWSVEDNKRWFRTEHGRVDYREYTAFALQAMLQNGEDEAVRQNIRFSRAQGFTVARVILAYTGVHRTNSGPQVPNFWPSLDRLFQIAGEEGMHLRITYLGSTEPWGGVWDAATRRDVWEGNVRAGGEAFVLDVARHICGREGYLAELANEPGQIGMRDSFDELRNLGFQVKQVCPSQVLGGGAVDGPNDGDPRFAVTPFDYVDAHIERRTGVQGFEWVKRTGEYLLIDQDDLPTGWRGPFISGEPINFIGGRGDDRDESPSVAFAYAAVSRARHYNTNFHFDGGLFGRAPAEDGRGAASVLCYHAALDAFPMDTAGKWRGHWGGAAGDYWRDWWPNSDDIREVEAHLLRGAGPWRAFGAGIFSVLFPEPDGWNFAAQAEVPVTQVATCSAGAFQASVYRRQ